MDGLAIPDTDSDQQQQQYLQQQVHNQPQWVQERPITFEDLGIPRTQTIRPSVFGNIRTCQSLRILEWMLLIGGLLSVLVTVSVALYRLSILREGSYDYVFAILLIFHSGFCIIYVLDGVFREQAFEILALVASSAILIIYVIINFTTNKSLPIDKFKLVRLIVTLVLGVCVFVVGSILSSEYWQSKNLIFRTVGADTNIQAMCSTLFTTITLIMFDAQIVGSVVILALHHGIRHLDIEEILTITVGSPFLIAWALIAYLALRLESKYFFGVALCLSPFHLAFIVLAVVQTILNHESGTLADCRYAASALSLTVHIILIIFMIKSRSNFGRGLKEKVYPRQSDQNDSTRNLVQ